MKLYFEVYEESFGVVQGRKDIIIYLLENRGPASLTPVVRFPVLDQCSRVHYSFYNSSQLSKPGHRFSREANAGPINSLEICLIS